MKLVDFIEALEEAASKYMVPLRILVRTDNAVKARVEISENICQKSSLMMYLRYCYVRDWFKFLSGWISTGCTGNGASGGKGVGSYSKISTQLVVAN